MIQPKQAPTNPELFKPFYYEIRDQLRGDLPDIVAVYNLSKRLNVNAEVILTHLER